MASKRKDVGAEVPAAATRGQGEGSGVQSIIDMVRLAGLEEPMVQPPPTAGVDGDEPAMEETLAVLRIEELRLRALLEQEKPKPRPWSRITISLALSVMVGAQLVLTSRQSTEWPTLASGLLCITALAGLAIYRDSEQPWGHGRSRGHLHLAELALGRVTQLIVAAEEYMKEEEAEHADPQQTES